MFFAVIVCVACLVTAFVVAKALHYDIGLAAGLLSGACTISAVLGVATDSINQLAISPEQKKALIDVMPVAYAVTYIFGTAGSAWFLATLGPKILVSICPGCQRTGSRDGRRRNGAGSNFRLSGDRGSGVPDYQPEVDTEEPSLKSKQPANSNGRTHLRNHPAACSLSRFARVEQSLPPKRIR